MTKDSAGKIIRANPIWLWSLPLICLLLMAVVYLTGSNMELFLRVNSFSEYTGGMIWAILTFFSDGLVSFIILLPWIRKQPRIIWAVILATVLFTLFGQGLKRVVNVPRPPQVLPDSAFNLIGPDWGQHSFPSGHAAMIFILAGVFSLTTSRVWLRAVLIGGASVIAMSRIVVGVHWPQDVLAGIAIGWLAAWVGLVLSEHTKWGWGIIAQKIFGALLILACVLMFFIDYTGYENIMIVQRIIAVLFLSIGTLEYLKIYGIHLFGEQSTS
ncbi:phosphatase PAP2 family protein [Acidobacteriota bacterium]